MSYLSAIELLATFNVLNLIALTYFDKIYQTTVDFRYLEPQWGR